MPNLSPNFDERKLPISMLVLHYTGMESGEAAIARLQDPVAKVSAHYVVDEDGSVLQLVDDHDRAWHAGVGSWQGITDVNSASIGIEIINGGHDFPDANGALPEFPDAQILAVIQLSKKLMMLHNIAPNNVVGHSDIAPARKRDPGEHFPWKKLAKNGVGTFPKLDTSDTRVLFGDGDRDRGVAIVQRALAQIGYGAEVTGVMDKPMRLIIAALQRRYRPEQIDGLIDVQTMEVITKLAQDNSNSA